MEGTDLAGETGAATIDLTEQEDGKTWKLASARYADYSKIGIKGDKDHRLLMIEEGVIKAAQMGQGVISYSTSTLSSTNILRPVTLIRIAEE